MKWLKWIWNKWWIRWGVYAGMLCLLFVIVANVWVEQRAKGAVFQQVEEIPQKRVALVLGTIPVLANGRKNRFFEFRMDAAASLYEAGKVSHFLVSGDNHREGYDEPTAMKEALIQRGVPESVIHLDYAGFRTLDSVIRAKEVFGQSELMIISQHFHNVRAVFLAKSKGIDAVAFDARNVSRRHAPYVFLREYVARVAAVIDVLIGRNPKFLGEKIEI